jgi:hypothetical protein
MAVFLFGADLSVGGFNTLQVDPAGDVLAVSTGPTFPNPWKADCKLVEFVNDLIPPMGGVAQRIARLGARFSVTFSQTPALGAACARAILAARLQARANGDTTVFAWPQPVFTGAIGSPVVNGANQRGTSLVVNGLTASTPLLVAGTFFSIAIGGRNYLHCLTADATVDGSGNSTLSIAPMLRDIPASGAALNFALPCIEGFIQGHTEDWTLERLAWTGLPSFTVIEAR